MYILTIFNNHPQNRLIKAEFKTVSQFELTGKVHKVYKRCSKSEKKLFELLNFFLSDIVFPKQYVIAFDFSAFLTSLFPPHISIFLPLQRRKGKKCPSPFKLNCIYFMFLALKIVFHALCFSRNRYNWIMLYVKIKVCVTISLEQRIINLSKNWILTGKQCSVSTSKLQVLHISLKSILMYRFGIRSYTFYLESYLDTLTYIS